jgi:twitching motility protein PilT
MAAIDALLRVMTLRDADGMILTAGQPPHLRRRGQVEALLMPALEASMLGVFVDELVAGEHKEKLATAGSVSVVHTTEGTAFPILVEHGSGAIRLSVRAPAPAAAPIPAPAPAPAAAAAPAPAAVPAAVPLPVSVSLAAAPRVLPVPTERVVSLVAAAAAASASDLLLSTTLAPVLRVEGDLRAVDDDGPITAADIQSLVSAPAELDARGSEDLALEIAGVRLRVNVFRHAGGLGAALRLIRDRTPSLRDLGLPEELDAAARHPNGLVLVCGPAGSGKSTTLVALVDEIDRRRAAHVITLEDPIEYRFRPRRCLIHQREIGDHAASFADGLRAALREAPDVIVVGELRDPETIGIALTAAETGHLVLATLHAPHAVGAIDRVIDAFPETQQRQARAQLAASLRVIVTQHLLPRRSGGRVVAIEHVPATAAVGNLIRKGELQLLPTHIQAGRDLGMIPLERSLAKLVKTGAITANQARAIAHEPELMEAALR